MIYLDRRVIFSFQNTLWTVDHTWPTVDHDLPYMHFVSKKTVFFPSVMVHERSIVIYLAHQRWTFFNGKLKHIPDVAQPYVR